MNNQTARRFITVENEDGRFLVLPNDVLGKHLLRGERWEPHYSRIIPLLLPPGGTAVDVGACIGYTTVVMAKAAGAAGQIIAFEPLSLVFNQLCENISLNGLTNVTPYNLCLGNADNVTVSMVPVNYDQDDVNIMNTCVGIGGDLVQMRTLDSFALNNVSLLKIDVQGLEPFVLRGAESTISRNRPFMLLEIEEPQLKTQNFTPAQVMAEVLFNQYILIRLIGRYLCDYVCVPKEKESIIPEIVRAAELRCEVIEMLDGGVVSNEVGFA